MRWVMSSYMNRNMGFLETELNRATNQLELVKRKMSRWSSDSFEYKELFKECWSLEQRVREVEAILDSKREIIIDKHKKKTDRKMKQLNHQRLLDEQRKAKEERLAKHHALMERDKTFIGKIEKTTSIALHKVKKIFKEKQ